MINAIDILMARAAFYLPDIFKLAEQLENRLYAKQLHNIKIQQPVYICGLARSGTTIMLESLTRLKGTASHQYRDFPFLFSPLFWNYFQDRFAKPHQAKERIHQDGIFITPQSPEAQEEPLWQYFFPHTHQPKKSHLLNKHTGNKSFAEFYQQHIKKILYLRQGKRYICKGNYNISRIEYLASLFPDAHFIIMIRHPYEHIASLVKQHNQFSDYAKTNPYFSEYLKYSGHYEFGPQRQPINFSWQSSEEILSAWKNNAHHVGYAYMWRDIYQYIQTLKANKNVSKNIHLLPFEEFCDAPQETLTSLVHALDLEPGKTLSQAAEKIHPPQLHNNFFCEQQKQEIWDITGTIAEKYGYRPKNIPRCPQSP